MESPTLYPLLTTVHCRWFAGGISSTLPLSYNCILQVVCWWNLQHSTPFLQLYTAGGLLVESPALYPFLTTVYCRWFAGGISSTLPLSCPCVLQVVCWRLIYFYSILGCVLPLQEVALHQSPPSFSVLCYPCPYRSLLPHNVISPTPFWPSADLTPSVCHSVLLKVHLLSFIRAMCQAHFHFVFVTYWTMSVTQVLYLMVVLRILSFGLTLSIFLSMARWLVSSFFTNAFCDRPCLASTCHC